MAAVCVCETVDNNKLDARSLNTFTTFAGLIISKQVPEKVILTACLCLTCILYTEPNEEKNDYLIQITHKREKEENETRRAWKKECTIQHSSPKHDGMSA